LHLIPTTRRSAASVLVLALSLALAGCSGFPAAAMGTARGVPGFDTRDYPGPAAMAAWRQASPYRWVGFYLPAPCYTGTTWMGKRAEIERLGWGWAVLFVGEQDWGEIAGAPQTAVPPDPAAPRCTRTNLTTRQGAMDAASATATARSEGFPAGTVIYLDVERVERVSADLAAYVRAWADGILQEGRYTPGLYAHEHNVEALYAVFVAAFALRARTDSPRLWVVSTRGFDLTRSPAESPAPWASVWQGVLDVRESWGGVTLHIDANVARSANPSR